DLVVPVAVEGTAPGSNAVTTIVTNNVLADLVVEFGVVHREAGVHAVVAGPVGTDFIVAACLRLQIGVADIHTVIRLAWPAATLNPVGISLLQIRRAIADTDTTFERELRRE